GAGAGAVLLGGALAACGDDEGDTEAAGAGLTSASLAMGWISNVEYGGNWLALDQGFYEEEGIEIEYLTGGPNAPAPTIAVAAGDAQIGVSASLRRFADAVIEGNDFVIFGTQYQTSPGGVLSLAEKPVRTPEDLVGIRFLGQEGVDITIDAVLDIAGLEKEYEFIPAGFTPDPLVEGAGDAYSCFVVNQPITLEEQFGMVAGEDYVVTTWAELGLPAYANMYFCQRTFLEENPDYLEKFLRATIKGWELNTTEDPGVAAALAVDEYGADLGLDINQQTRQNELQIPLMQGPLTDDKGLFWIDADTLGGEMWAALEAAGRDSLPDAESVIDLSILEAVYDGETTLL
ncbi:MAG: ABC transporter substrate-binding protein, partial [Actinomycetota bacterium]